MKIENIDYEQISFDDVLSDKKPKEITQKSFANLESAKKRMRENNINELRVYYIVFADDNNPIEPILYTKEEYAKRTFRFRRLDSNSYRIKSKVIKL